MEIEKSYFTLPEILERWSMSEADLIYLAENDQLRLSIRVFNLAVEFGDYEETPEGERFSVPFERSPFNGLLDLQAHDVFHLTPSQRTICRLRASAHRTSASACSSAPSPWTQSLAGWATASARDHKDGSECRSVPINALLGRQVWLAGWPTAMAGSPATAAYNAAGNTDASRRTVKLVDWSKTPTPPEPMRRTASGEIRTGSSAAMAAGGPLSPEHSRWLMGYPAAWGSCGATVKRSCRRSRRSS